MVRRGEPGEPARVYAFRPRTTTPSDSAKEPELNPEQQAAATHDDGPLLVIAGAGTGKTRTLVHRVAHLIERGIQAERILLLTFTRRAAQEMLSRVERLVGSASKRVSGGTFHSTGHRILRRWGPAAGLPRDFSIMDQGDAEDLMQIARNSIGVAKKEKRFPKKETLHYLYSRHINIERPLEEVLQAEYPQFVDYAGDIVRIYVEYLRRKQERNLVDYDDLLLSWALLLENAPTLADQIASQYDHILVDEYQDTNLLQARVLRGMCRTHRNLTVVGDDAQSVYSFRGAHFRNILDFPRQFPGARMVTLEQNYRSTQPILDVTNIVISRAAERFTKNLWSTRAAGERPWLVTARDEHQQTRFLADHILELHEEGAALRDMAVLFRAGYMSADLEIELANRKIPFDKWGGLKFLEAAHVKDVLAFLRILENPRDEVSWYRVLLLMQGIGETTARSLTDSLAVNGWSLDAFSTIAVPPRARDGHRALATLLAGLRLERATPRGIGDEIVEIRRIYDDILRERYDHPEPRLADLDQLRVIAAGYPDRAAFLSAIALEPPQSTQDLADGSAEEDDALILSTVHSAKGKEWDSVFVIWAVDGWFPSSRSLEDDAQLEEERRLMYVALTRARTRLIVTYPLNVYSSRRSVEYSMDQLSRFFDPGVRERMVRMALSEEGAPIDEPVVDRPSAPDVNLWALLKGRFSAGA